VSVDVAWGGAETAAAGAAFIARIRIKIAVRKTFDLLLYLITICFSSTSKVGGA
jgi:hypothetical protein